MISSMTGYGQGRFAAHNFVITINLKSANHRHFDLSVRLPQELQVFENQMKNTLKEKLCRGAVSATVFFEGAGELSVKINEPVATAYLHAAREIKEKFQLEGDLSLDSVLRLPNVVTFGNVDLMADENLKAQCSAGLEQALQSAVAEIMTMRSAEGKQLEKDLRGRLQAISQHVEAIEAAMQSNMQSVYEKLKADVVRLTQSVNVDAARLAQEVAYLAEKSDVTEEVTRLKSHIQQFFALLDGDGEMGKKLDFLLQEMHRETNTILSKTASIFGEARQASDRALEVKAEIEKLREQVQNVI